MKAAATKDKKTLIVSSIFGVLLLVFVAYAYNTFFGGSTNPAATATPAPVSGPIASRPNGSVARTEGSANNANTGNAKTGMGVAPGIAATKLASTSASLDPTLDESAMLRTESLIYSGTGRNIFSAIYVPPVVIPKNVPNARPGAVKPVVPTGPPPPPPPPPINLKFFGTAVRANGQQQVFLLNGEDVYLASTGDIVARKYKIVSIGANSIQVEDLQNNNTQSLPLQAR
jgi:hypothetical protein